MNFSLLIIYFRFPCITSAFQLDSNRISIIVRPKLTFAVDEQGYKSWSQSARYVVVAIFVWYSTGSLDFQEPYLRALFNFIGITDIQFVVLWAEFWITRTIAGRDASGYKHSVNWWKTGMPQNARIVACLRWLSCHELRTWGIALVAGGTRGR